MFVRQFVLFVALLLPLGAMAVEFDGARAWEGLLAQCAFGPRDPGSVAHQQCLDYLTKELSRCTASVERQEFLAQNPQSKETVQLTNIIAQIQPQIKRRVLLCAHWDCRPWADQEKDEERKTKPILGANDGASGVAVLLEIARCLSQEPPAIGVDIVLFDGEDMGREGHLGEYLLGSQEYARNLTLPLPEAAILLDLVGDKDLCIPQEQHSRRFAPQLLEEVYRCAAELHQTAFVAYEGAAVYDDHVPLLQAGIPAIDLVDFDYPYWHTLKDTPENCSAQSLEAVGQVVLAWVYARAERH